MKKANSQAYVEARSCVPCVKCAYLMCDSGPRQVGRRVGVFVEERRARCGYLQEYNLHRRPISLSFKRRSFLARPLDRSPRFIYCPGIGGLLHDDWDVCLQSGTVDTLSQALDEREDAEDAPSTHKGALLFGLCCV